MIRCLTYLPHSYSGRGPAESCMQILSRFGECGIAPELFVARQRVPVPGEVTVRAALGKRATMMPYDWTKRLALRRLEKHFRKALATAEPGSLAYFWPDTHNALVAEAKAAGLTCVREMINSPLATAKPILDDAYARHGIAPQHGITQARIDAEMEQLDLCDYIIASNPEVESALKSLGVRDEKILATTFGYSAQKHGSDASPRGKNEPFRACFVGALTPRKGILEALAAWEQAQIDGEFSIAGSIEPEIRKEIEPFRLVPGVRLLGHVADVGAVYRACDLFVFPTYEEGGPQVTYEAAAYGLPSLTTPMGAARLVRDGETGVIVPAGDVNALTEALRRLSRNRIELSRLGENARKEVRRFEYAEVSRQRAGLLKAVIADHAPR